MLVRGGLFAFSVEAHDGPEDFVLRESRRYAHSEAYVAVGWMLPGFRCCRSSAKRHSYGSRQADQGADCRCAQGIDATSDHYLFLFGGGDVLRSSSSM
jgi:hypothetical protein